MGMEQKLDQTANPVNVADERLDDDAPPAAVAESAPPEPPESR